MYIKRKLMKELKNLYFKGNYKFSFPVDYNKEQFSTIQRNEDLDEEIETIILDLIYLDNKDFVRSSKVGREAEENINSLSARIFHSLQHTKVMKELEEILLESKNSCLVGGAVRDLCNFKQPKDYDFVTDIPYDTLRQKFIEAGFDVKETGKQFLVLNVTKDGESYEVANFRKDNTYKDGRRPESTEIGTILDDALRRDFTINAGYYNLSSHKFIDPSGLSTEDILDKTLRFVGSAKDRINEDYLRVMRFYRFISKGYSPNKKDLSTVRNMFGYSLEKTDNHRIMMEIEKMVGI